MRSSIFDFTSCLDDLRAARLIAGAALLERRVDVGQGRRERGLVRGGDRAGGNFGLQLLLQFLQWRLVAAGGGRRNRGHDGSVGYAGFRSGPRNAMVNGLNETLPSHFALICGVLRAEVQKQSETKIFAFWPESWTNKAHGHFLTPTFWSSKTTAKPGRLIAKYLRNNACNVTAVSDGREMSRAMADHRVDLIVLDLNLRYEDGLSLCRELRTKADQTPIIMLTARTEPVDRIIGLEMGADDYWPKPFEPRELLARINAVLRRQAVGAGRKRDRRRHRAGLRGLAHRSAAARAAQSAKARGSR